MAHCRRNHQPTCTTNLLGLATKRSNSKTTWGVSVGCNTVETGLPVAVRNQSPRYSESANNPTQCEELSRHMSFANRACGASSPWNHGGMLGGLCTKPI